MCGGCLVQQVEKGVFVRGVLVWCVLLCVCFAVWGLGVVLRARVAVGSYAHTRRYCR